MYPVQFPHDGNGVSLIRHSVTYRAMLKLSNVWEQEPPQRLTRHKAADFSYVGEPCLLFHAFAYLSLRNGGEFSPSYYRSEDNEIAIE